MNVIRDPRLYEKNKQNYNILYYILNNKGSCLIVDCINCPFHYDINSIEYPMGLGCHILDTFNVAFNSYNGNKIYYAAMLFSLYTNAEKLTYLIQGEFNGTNT